MAKADEKDCVSVKEHPPVDDTTLDIIGNIMKVAAIASAVDNAQRAVTYALKEYDLAYRYWNIAKKWMNHYTAHFAPVEDQELREAMALPVAKPEYEAARGRARASAWIQFRGVVEKTMRCMSRYCTGLRNDMLTDLASAQGHAVALADGLGYRTERAYTESRNDVRFDKMFNTAKRGRDMVADNVSLAKATANIYGDMWNQAWEGLKGSGYYLGYAGNRNPTVYPTTYLSGQTTTFTEPSRSIPVQQQRAVPVQQQEETDPSIQIALGIAAAHAAARTGA